MSDALHWHDISLCRGRLPADHVLQGEAVRLVMSEQAQRQLLENFFLCPLSRHCDERGVWLVHHGEVIQAGTPEFCQRVACMIRQRGLLANLTLKENLLLPFLYSDQKGVLQEAEQALPRVAQFLGLDGKLHEKAGERSDYVHALMSLGHCLLKKPALVVAQELHLGMPKEHAKRFQRKMLRALKALQPGVLYLTSSASDNPGLSFHRTHEVDCDSHTALEWL